MTERRKPVRRDIVITLVLKLDKVDRIVFRTVPFAQIRVYVTTTLLRILSKARTYQLFGKVSVESVVVRER